jgi:archaellum biogenesis ATPase FlaH
MEQIFSFEQEFTNLSEGWIVLLETSAEKAMDLSISALKYLINDQDYLGIVVSSTRPYDNLIQLYQKYDIDVSHLLILDTISKSQHVDNGDESNAIFLDDVSDLTGLSLVMKGSMEKITEKKFIFIDSISSMLIHNEPSLFARFIHGMLTKMRIHKTSGLLISLEKKTDDDVRAEIAQLCDRVIKI